MLSKSKKAFNFLGILFFLSEANLIFGRRTSGLRDRDREMWGRGFSKNDGACLQIENMFVGAPFLEVDVGCHVMRTGAGAHPQTLSLGSQPSRTNNSDSFVKIHVSGTYPRQSPSVEF